MDVRWEKAIEKLCFGVAMMPFDYKRSDEVTCESSQRAVKVRA
jgi:hypothetical protein